MLTESFVEQSQSLESSGLHVVLDGHDDSIHPNNLYMSRLNELVDQTRQVRWLDVGCGWHCDWPWQEEREKALIAKANVTGVDPDWQAITRHRTIVKRTVGIIEALPFEGNTFDLVTANVVVEHLKHPALAFAEVFRVLRQNGAFLFRTPSARSYFVRIARRLPEPLKVWLASRIERRQVEDIYPALYLANTTEAITDICRLVGFRKLQLTITKSRPVFARMHLLARAERLAATASGMTEGTLIGTVYK